MPSPDSERLPASRIASHLGVMVLVAALMGLVTAGLVIPFAGVAGIGARDVARSMDDLPEELKTSDLAQRTQVVDGEGNVIAQLYDENRITVSLSQISRKMLESIVAIEDYRYYQHGALDLKGTVRALVTNQMDGGTVQGGSSITQQLVKLTLVDQAESKEEQQAAVVSDGMAGYARKLKELRYAIALEKEHSKDWILERYLNTAYFGDGAFGIQSAAKHYFGVNAKDLNYAQSAMLAGLVKNPTAYDPTNNSPDRTIERRNVVLQRMAELNVIPQAKADKLKSQKLRLKLEKINNGCVNSRAPFFCQYARAYLLADPDLGKTVKERERLLNSGGLTIHTTIDLRYQEAADKAVQANVYAKDQAIGALAMVQPKTGQVKAIAQSRPMGSKARRGQTYLNYVVPKKYGNANGFQAGSTFKVFVLAAAIHQGIPLTKSIASPQQMTLSDSAFDTCGGGRYYGSGEWNVANSTGEGTYNMYSGTQKSVNTFYAQLEAETGLCEPWKLAKKMGVHIPDDEVKPSYVLGVTDTNPLELAEAYATFAGRGMHCAASPVTRIENSAGEVIKEYTPDCQQVMPSAVADAVNDILKGVQEPGGFGGDQGLGLSVESAAKTGTINSNMAVWYMGYTPELSTAAMIAGADRKGNWITLNGQVVGGDYINSAFGSTEAGPMWADAMQTIDDWLDGDDFRSPTSGEIAGFLTEVPNVSGLSIRDAERKLRRAGFDTAVGYDVNSELAEGTVVYTYPGAGSEFGAGDTITMYPSTGYVPPPPPANNNGGKGGKGGKGKGGKGPKGPR